MTVQRTLSIIKPDATRRNLTGRINTVFEENGLRIVAQKRIRLTLEQAKAFYKEHEGKPFFEGLVQFMVSGPVVVQVLEAPDAIAQNRRLMGATNPEQAEEGTIRKMFALSQRENSVHGSDGEISAEREISFFFNELEITG